MGGAIFAARRLNPEHQSLYEGLDERVFGEMSPHVFAYEKDSRFARLWLLLGRPRHWGVQLVSKASRAEVVAHLSRFLLVDYEDDKGHRDQVYLRFGDPRVMHTLLRALHPSQRSMFFGPIEQWIVADDEDPNRDVTYSLGEDGGLVAQSGDAPIPRIAPYDAVKEAKSPELGKDDALARSIIGRFGQLQALSSAHEGVVPFSSVCPCNEFEVGRRSELLIDRAQGKLFSVHSLRWYKHRLWAWLSGTAGKHLAPEALRQLIDDGVSVAAQYGIVSQSDVSDFVQLMLRLGPHFHRARSARVILNDSSLSPGEKLRRLKNRDRGARGPSSEEGPKPSRPE
ncbi:MAG: DUF4123 domain-containing protein [Proteobacteria bacterium]|nr:DUF4123 domain-containing protein [Pseudomonadota bacterium]